jgi:DNA-binding CsgD family transcriptional regulator
MQDRFEARIRDVHKRTRQLDKELRGLVAHFNERPRQSAQALVFAVPAQMAAWRRFGVSRFGIDLGDHEQRKNLNIETLQDALTFILIANKYEAHKAAWEWMMEALGSLPGTLEDEELARAVCDAFLEAMKQQMGLLAATIEMFQKALPRLANQSALAEFLTAYFATHTSVWVNKRLRAGLDDRRKEGESRFSRLIKELPAESLVAYDEKPRAWGDLKDLRTVAARQLEKQSERTRRRRERQESTEESELATFADRERLLQRAKAVGLSPQELEVFRLFVQNPKIRNKDVAAQLGMSASQVGVVKLRAKRKLAAVGH